MHTFIRPALYNAHHRNRGLQEKSNEKLTDYTIAGPICESSDIFQKILVYLNKKLVIIL